MEFVDAEDSFSQATVETEEIEHIDATLEMWGETEWWTDGVRVSPQDPV